MECVRCGLRVLLISYHFPPSLAARGLQLGKLVKYAVVDGVEFDVITSASQEISDLERAGLPIRVWRCPQTGRNWTDRLSSFVSGMAMRQWAHAAAEVGCRILSERGSHYYNCLMTCSHPIDSHCAGHMVRRKFPQIPWLAHFSDPWANNPIAKPHGPWQRPIMNWHENRIISSADRLVFVCEPLREYVMRRYPCDVAKSCVLHHVFDPDLYGEPHQSRDGCLRIAYVGGLSRERSIEPLLHMLHCLKTAGINAGQLVFEFVGEDSKDAANALNAEIPGIARSMGKVGYIESLRYMRQADALLIIDANLQESPYFPSKLADYYGAGVPVLGISPANSCTTEMLRQLDMPVYDYGHLDACAAFIAAVATGSSQLPVIPKQKILRFSAANVAKEFEHIVAAMSIQEG